MRRLPLALAAVALLVGGLPSYGADAPPERTVRAGVGVVDATWNTGAAAGQYASENTSLVENVGSGGDVDPYQHSRAKEKSYGTHSRLTVRALVVEGTDGHRVALLKTDNYLAQDLLLRRVGQLLDEGDSGVGYDDILQNATHDHSSPYYTTTSPGVFVFQDVFDQRMFEYQARAMRDAVEQAVDALQPARMAATTTDFRAMKANVVGPATADDGTPAGYPREFGDTGLVVMRFETADAPHRPIAAWTNFGEHPESLDGYGLTTADYVAPLERFVERDLGAPLVFSQGDVGSSEGPYEREDTYAQLPDGTYRAYAHSGYAQMERGARLMADAVVQGVERGRHRPGPGALERRLPRRPAHPLDARARSASPTRPSATAAARPPWPATPASASPPTASAPAPPPPWARWTCTASPSPPTTRRPATRRSRRTPASSCRSPGSGRCCWRPAPARRRSTSC